MTVAAASGPRTATLDATANGRGDLTWYQSGEIEGPPGSGAEEWQHLFQLNNVVAKSRYSPLTLMATLAQALAYPDGAAIYFWVA